MCRAKEVRWYVTIYITLWYVHGPRTDQHITRYVHLAIAMCTYHGSVPMVCLVRAHTKQTKLCLYISMNVVRAGTLGNMDPVSKPPNIQTYFSKN